MDLLETFREDVTGDDADRFKRSLKKSLPVGKYKKRSCWRMFSKTVTDEDLKFLEVIYLD